MIGIIDKMRQMKLGLIGKILIGTALAVSGCATQSNFRTNDIHSPTQASEDDSMEALGMLAIAGGMLAGGQYGSTLATTGRLGIQQAQSKRLANAIENSGTQVNLNVGDNHSDSTPFPEYDSEDLIPEYNLSRLKRDHDGDGSRIKSLFTYKHYFDISDGDLPQFEEFRGIKRNFKAGEPINIAVKMFYRGLFEKGNIKLSLKMFNEDGELIGHRDSEYNVKSGQRLVSRFPVGKLEPGVYNIQCDYLDNKNRKSTKKDTFQVLE